MIRVWVTQFIEFGSDGGSGLGVGIGAGDERMEDLDFADLCSYVEDLGL